MYSNYITKWTELTSTYTRELDELNMAGDVYVIQPKDDPFKLNIAYEYVENPIEDVCEFIVHYTLRSAYEHIASVNTVPYTKYARPVLYKDGETVYLGLQCFDINKTLIGVPSIALTTDETDSVRVISIQNGNDHFLAYKEEVTGQEVKRNYQVKTIISTLEAETAPIDVEKKWYLIYEYAYKYEQINPAVIEPQTFNEYTEENPYFVDGIVYQLPTSVYKYTKIEFSWGWDGATAGYSISLTSSDKGVYHRPAIYREADGSPVFAIYTYDENFQFVEKKINSRGASYKDKLIGLYQIRLYNPTAAYFDVYHYLPVGTRPELPNDHDAAAYRFTNHAKTQTKEPPAENMLELELKDYKGTPLQEEIELPFYGIKDTWATSEVPYLRFAYSVNGGTEIQKTISGSSYVYNRYYKVNLVHYTTSAIYFIVYTYDDKGVQNSRQMLSIGVNGGFDTIRLRLLGIYSNYCKVRNYEMKVKETFKIKNTFNTRRNTSGVIKNTYNTITKVREEVETDWSLMYEYVGSSNLNYKNILPAPVENDLFAGYTESNPCFLDVACENINLNATVKGNFYFKFGRNGATTNNGVNVTTTAIGKYTRPAVYRDADNCYVFAIYTYNEAKELIDIAKYKHSSSYNNMDLGISEIQVYNPSGVSYDVYQKIPKTAIVEPVYINPKELLFYNEASTYSKVPLEDAVLESELKDYSGTEPNEIIELPFYGVRRTSDDLYTYIRFEYSTDGGASKTQKTAYAYNIGKWHKLKLSLYCDANGNLWFNFIPFDKDGAPLNTVKVSSGVNSPGGFSDITIRLLGFYGYTVRMYNCKERIIERYPIEHKYATKAITQRDYKNVFNTLSKIFAFEEVKKSFDTNVDIVQKIAKAYNTINTVVKESKVNFTTSRKVIKSAIIKTNYDTSSRIVKDITTKHSTKLNVTAKVSNIFDTKFSIGRDVKVIHSTIKDIYAGCLKRYNTSKEVKYTSKELFDTDRTVKRESKTVYNTVIKTAYEIKNVYTTVQSIYGSITNKHNTSTKIITDVSNKFTTSIKTENRINKKYDVIKAVSLEYRNAYNTHYKTFSRVKNKYNTESSVRFYVIARYSTQRETDMLAVIKTLLGITDNSKDGLLRFLVFKGIEDIHAVCNLEKDELTKPKAPAPIARIRTVFSEEGINYFSADSELGQNRHLQNILIDLVIYYYRMQGMEHLKNESIEGGSWNYIYESIPPQILARLKPYKRLPKLRVF